MRCLAGKSSGMPPSSGNDFCIDATSFVANISRYLTKFIISSIGHNLPVPLNVNHPQNIFEGFLDLF